MSAKLGVDGDEEDAEEEEGVAWDGDEEEEDAEKEEEEGGIRRETARERRQRRRQRSKDTLKQLCAYTGLRHKRYNKYTGLRNNIFISYLNQYPTPRNTLFVRWSVRWLVTFFTPI